MSLALAILGWTAFALAVIAGLLLDLLGLFGNWIIFAAVALAWVITGFERFSGLALGILFALAVLGELIEAGASAIGAAGFGGSRGGAIAAIVGCLLGGVGGTPLFPVLGTLLGAIIGAFLGAVLYEYIKMERAPKQALYAGVGAAIGKVGGILGKLIVGLIMLAVAWLLF